MKSKRIGLGILKGMAITLKNALRRPVTTQYPEEKLDVSRRTRGPEFIWDKEQCSGCMTCMRACPQGSIHIQTSGPGVVAAPCSQGCPAGINIPAYLRAIARGEPEEAVAVIREKIPFPIVCGRVCFHPCETKCQRAQIDEPVSIRVMKRYATDHDTGVWRERAKAAPPTGKKVAIIGAGPAGLTTAYYLARLGHAVTVFEALPEPGGMMHYGIPDYRLPKNELKADIDEIRALGVDIRTNTRVESVDKLLEQGYDAVFVALGAHDGMRIGVEGENSPGVMDCAYFLREVSLGKPVEVGERVAIIGGGNAAVDAARTALRLGGKKVVMLYRRTRAEMPANPEEVVAALDENIEIQFLVAPSRISVHEGELWLECIKMQLGAPDESGRRRPEPVKGSEFTLAFDTIIGAIGQRPDIPKELGLPVGRGNVIQAEVNTLATTKKGVFAGGDCVSGPASVIEAIAAGRRAAKSIDLYLGGTGIIDEKLAKPEAKEKPLTRATEDRRIHPPEVSAAERVKGFTEIEESLTEEEAVTEASRCLRCDFAYAVDEFLVDTGHCIFCGLCVESCPRHALFLGTDYEQAKYRRKELVTAKEAVTKTDKSKPSGFARPEVEETLPKQTLLLDRDKEKK
ncbi:MAG: FAD-dependent oxidoreductase [Chloroflexi bacterium]|nr:FAD-dependent oxidoreductase [Chloroflexota bacterium]